MDGVARVSPPSVRAARIARIARSATETAATARYGLGQTYELLKMSMYSLYYYRQAQQLRPTDARMWTALAKTYSDLEQWASAAKCYGRNHAITKVDPAPLYELGSIYLAKVTPKDPDTAACVFRCLLLY